MLEKTRLLVLAVASALGGFVGCADVGSEDLAQTTEEAKANEIDTIYYTDAQHLNYAGETDIPCFGPIYHDGTATTHYTRTSISCATGQTNAGCYSISCVLESCGSYCLYAECFTCP